MPEFSPLLSISITHDFYTAAPARDLSILPLPETRQLMNNAGLILRENPDGITLFFDREKTETLAAFARDEVFPFVLNFKVLCKNPLFENFTLLPPQTDKRLVFLTGEGEEKDGAPLSLTKTEYLGPGDLVDAVSLAELLAQERFPVPPVCLVAITPFSGPPGPDPPEHRTYHIRFQQRESIWKYLLMGKFADPGCTVVDLDGKVTFSRKTDETLPGSRRAGVAESDIPLPLGGEDPFRFQLRRQNGNSERIMVPRLPLAPVDRINMRNGSNNTKEFFSEIFINP